jgi:hypothetical protein
MSNVFEATYNNIEPLRPERSYRVFQFWDTALSFSPSSLLTISNTSSLLIRCMILAYQGLASKRNPREETAVKSLWRKLTIAACVLPVISERVMQGRDVKRTVDRETSLAPELVGTKVAPIRNTNQFSRNNASLLSALHDEADLNNVVPRVLDILEQDPLTSAGTFRGDLLRALIELPAEFWHRDPAAFERYKSVVRAGAVARLSLPSEERMEFWTNDRG